MRRIALRALIGLSLVSGTRAAADCTIVSDETITCEGITYRAVDEESVYYVDLLLHNTSHPGVPLPDLKKTVTENYAADAVPDPVVVALTDYVDCTGTSHNFQQVNLCGNSPFPNKPSRLMNISGKSFRVTAAPDDGFATYYYSYDVANGGTAGVPHVLAAELSNDQERYTSLSIHHPDDDVITPGLPWALPYTGEPTYNPWGGDPEWWGPNLERTQQGGVFGPDVGVAIYTGRELPIDHQPYNVNMLWYPKTTTTRVVVSSLGCNVSRTSSDGGAVSRMWVFQLSDAIGDRLPVHTLPEDPAQQRRIGIYMTHPWFFYAHYGTPCRLLSHRQAGLQRMVRQFRFCGFNYIVFNAINGSDRTGKSWYPGSAHFDWNSAGDLLSELPPIAEAEAMQLVPLITSLKHPTYTGGLSFTGDSYQMGADGDYHRAFGNETMDPLRPEVQQLVFNLLGEIAGRCASSPAVRGIGIRANGKIGTCYTSDQNGWDGASRAGYSAWDLQQFKNDTGSAVPTSPPASAYDWLQARPTEWESWIDWRCTRTRQFWLACRDLIQSYRSDLIFYVQCDLPSELPGTNIEWANGQTPYNLLRHHGYDPDMFANDEGIVITRGMMVALDRFKVSSRWGPPHGTNYQNYRLFHYAPGLAELYRTAEGRSCEFYQDYWEEAFNPYYEYGSCGDPAGFFRTHTPTAFDRSFFAGATMSMRRQDPDTMTWLGWERPTLANEPELRKFAQAFRALPTVDPIAFDGTVEPATVEVVARWHGDRLAVINDSEVARTITLHFSEPVPVGDELVDVVTGRKLVSESQLERQDVSFEAEAYSLNTFLYVEGVGPSANFTTGPLPNDPPLTVQFYDASTAENITTWDWDFGDGSPHGSGPNPLHTYADYDTYDVTLTITADGGSYVRVKPITLAAIPPTVTAESPPRGASLNSLPSVSVTFSKPVTGVDAGDLTVNGSSATTVVGNGAGPYLFKGFSDPGVGPATVTLASGGILDLGGVPFTGDGWTYTLQSPPVPGVGNPGFEDGGGSYNDWAIVHIAGEGPDNPPLDNGNGWGVTTPFGTHFGGKITSWLLMDFYLGQVVGVSDWDEHSTEVDWDLDAWVQLRRTHWGDPDPTGVHQVWEIGWNDDGTEPTDVMSCDNYQIIASIDGNFTGNAWTFHELTANGTLANVPGLRGMVIRAHLYNDSGVEWTMSNIDNLSFAATSVPPLPIPGDFDEDRDVDADDVAVFLACATGSALGPPSLGCDVADLDGDDDVDQSDFGHLQRCLSGVDTNADPTCAQ